MISIVMTTYNGSSFIGEQLNSILQQTLAPDEVIIQDDNSTDGTAEIVRNFLKEHDLNSWKLFVNRKNLGWTSNFFDALKKSSGTIVFCSDQDDVWLPEKIETMTNIMLQNPSILSLTCNRIVIDESGNENNLLNSDGNDSFKYTLRASRNTCPCGAGGLRPLMYTNVSEPKKFNNRVLLGCCSAYRKGLIEKYIEINDRDYGHDAQLAKISALQDGAYYLQFRLVKYRIHNCNTSGVRGDVPIGSSTLHKRKQFLKKNIEWLSRLYEIENDKEKRKVIRNHYILQKNRLKFLEHGFRGIGRLLIAFPQYIKYASMQLLIGDFCYATGINGFAGHSFWKIKHKRTIR